MPEQFAQSMENEAGPTAFHAALHIVVEKQPEVIFHFVVVADSKLAYHATTHNNSALSMTAAQYRMKLTGGALSEDNLSVVCSSVKWQILRGSGSLKPARNCPAAWPSRLAQVCQLRVCGVGHHGVPIPNEIARQQQGGCQDQEKNIPHYCPSLSFSEKRAHLIDLLASTLERPRGPYSSSEPSMAHAMVGPAV